MSEKQSRLQPPNTAHSLTLENRALFTMTGIEDVESFSAAQIILSTNMGRLVIRGKNLNITSLDTENGSMRADGTVDSLVYSPMKKKRSMMNALFK